MQAIDLLTEQVVLKTLKEDKGTCNLISWTTGQGDIKLGEHNFFNVVERVKVIYEKEGKEDNVSYMAKLNPCRGSGDECNPYRHRAMVKEKFFYYDLLPILNRELKELGQSPLNVPKCFFADVCEGSEVLVFEDLVAKSFENIPRSTQIDNAHIILMMQELAKLHAASISLRTKIGEDLTTVYPLLIESWMEGTPELRDGFSNMFTKGCLFNANLANTLPEYKYMVKWLENLAPRAMEMIVDNLQASDPWRVICHADYHKGNVMFRYDSNHIPVEVMVLDWQTLRVVPVSSEIQHLAFSSYFGPDRQDVINLSENIYFDTLSQIFSQANLSVPFSKEQLQEEDKSNQFSLLLCFFLIPLSRCVAKPEDLFTTEGNKFVGNNPEIYEKIFEQDQNLKYIFVEYLKEIERRKLMDV